MCEWGEGSVVLVVGLLISTDTNECLGPIFIRLSLESSCTCETICAAVIDLQENAYEKAKETAIYKYQLSTISTKQKLKLGCQ